MGSENAPCLLNSKHRDLRSTGVSKKGHHDFTLGGVHIVLQDFLLCSHRVDEGFQERAVIMLATLGWVWVGVDERKTAGNAGSDEVWGRGAELRGWRGAAVIPSISPTCSGAAIEPSFERFPAARAVDWRACLHIVLIEGACWP